MPALPDGFILVGKNAISILKKRIRKLKCARRIQDFVEEGGGDH